MVLIEYSTATGGVFYYLKGKIMETKNIYKPVKEWTFDRDGIEEVVEFEKWIWSVKYKNNFELLQFDKVGKFHQFQEIIWKNAVSFSMINVEDINKQFNIELDEGMQIFHFYKRIKLNVATKNEINLVTYVFGYKRKGEKSIYFYILPDGRLVITKDGQFSPFEN